MSRSSSLEKRVAKRVLELQDVQSGQSLRYILMVGICLAILKKGTRSSRRGGVNAAAVTGDTSWKEELMKKIQNLESAKKQLKQILRRSRLKMMP